MKFGLLFIMAFASENRENKLESAAKSDEKFHEKNDENLILVKIEEDDYTKEHKNPSRYIGVAYHKTKVRWTAYRWSKNEKKNVHNGTYKDEETAAHASDTLARKLMANGEKNLKLNFPDKNIEVYRPWQDKKFAGVCFYLKGKTMKWAAYRWSKKEKKNVFNGYDYKDEETAAHASDTLARKLIANGENNLKLNFPDDHTVYPEKKTGYKYIGIFYSRYHKSWAARRWSKHAGKIIFNGYYNDEETAARASDTLARKLMANAEQDHKLNFPDDHTEVYKEKKQTSSKYTGVSYNEATAKWQVSRWSKNEKKMFSNGSYEDEKTAAHASDTLAIKLMKNREHGHKLNFLDDNTKVYPQHPRNKRKRSEHDLGHSQNN